MIVSFVNFCLILSILLYKINTHTKYYILTFSEKKKHKSILKMDVREVTRFKPDMMLKPVTVQEGRFSKKIVFRDSGAFTYFNFRISDH